MSTQRSCNDADRAWQLWQRWAAQSHGASNTTATTLTGPSPTERRRSDPTFGCVDWFLYGPSTQPKPGSPP